MTGGNREQTAQLLGIGERTLYRKLREYGLK
jgi:two-component system response regulator HydG